MASASRRPSGKTAPLRPIFVVSILMATLLLLAYGWIERQWATAGFYLGILVIGFVFLAPPIWTYTRVTPLDESPETDHADSAEVGSELREE